MALEDALKRVATRKDDLAQVVDAIVEEAAKLVSSPISYLALMNKAGDVLTMIGWSQTVMASCKMIDKPIVYPLEKTGLWGDCVRERQPVVTNDYPSLKKPTKKGYPQGHVNVKRHLNVCIMDGAHIAGVIGVGNKQQPYDNVDVKLLQEFANRCYPLMPRQEVEAIVS